MILELNDYTDQIIELRIIESLLRDGIEAYNEIRDFVNENDFYFSGYRASFRILRNNFETLNKRSYDRGLLVSDLKKENPDFNSFDITEVEAWGDLQINTNNIYDFGLSLKESSRNREICRTLRKAVDIANDNRATETKKAEILKIIQDLTNSTEDEYIKDSLKVAKELNEKLRAGDVEKKFPTGFRVLDDALNGGYRKGSLNIIGARPGMGKSVLGLQIALNMLENDRDMKPIVFFSLEMDRFEIMERAYSFFSNATIKEFEEHRVSDDKFALLKLGIKEHLHHEADENERLILCDKPSLSLDDINKELSIIRARCGGIGAVIVDYLQLMDIDLKSHLTVATATGENSKGLKRLAGQYKCPVIALCQLNRDADRDSEPSLANLKDSGNIEQDANTIILVGPDEDRRQRKIYLKKNRGGKPDVKFKTLFWGEYSRFDTNGMEIQSADNAGNTTRKAGQGFSYGCGNETYNKYNRNEF